MLREAFLGRGPSHYETKGIIKAFILSDTLIWSAWNFVIPIFAIFVVNDVSGGKTEIAATLYSVYLVARVIIELVSGKYLTRKKDAQKILFILSGILCVSLFYFGLAQAYTISVLYVLFVLAGIGQGLAAPAKNSLFSTHLDKNKETLEWGIYDAAVFIGMALAAALGGFIARDYGFRLLFYVSSIINLLGIIPYLLFIKTVKKTY